ncbi:MAG: hypothetical protein QOD06_1841 [Candidatus Binatota bacterium]|jgi:hypothetical protein|nr:hypothetical protein [Candidatus Binatota bacterium]
MMPPLSMRVPQLSKTRFLSGLQCEKRLYFESYYPGLATPFDAATRARLDEGRRVGELARRRFAGGWLVAHDNVHHREAELETRWKMADPSVPAVYEAAFTHADVRVRADVLVRAPDGAFDLIEVKASTGVRPVHEPDLAVQLYVLEGAGVRIRRAGLMHLNRDYIYMGGAHDLSGLFAITDLTDSARAMRPLIGERLALLRAGLAHGDPPLRAPGEQCWEPYECPFVAHCGAERPSRSFADPPNEGARDGIRYVDPAIHGALAGAAFPIHFLDFETFMPAIPLYAGTRPYETIPFQWSDHVLDARGELSHREYLHDGDGDPRRRFAETLIEALGAEGAIVVYTAYEERCIRALEQALPDLAPALAAVRGRLFDIHRVIRSHVYEPAFNGSFSLKAVLPALVPGLGYDDLAIRDGRLASVTYGEIVRGESADGRRAELRDQLLAYCQRDTLAMLELYRTLR